MPYFMVIDVESVGLHGEGYAVGWVVVDERGHEVECGLHGCPPVKAKGSAEGHAWVKENAPALPTACPTPALLRETFWEHWERIRATWPGVVMAADCARPVEARFLAACIDDAPDARCWQGPYPLHDVATMRLAGSMDPLGTADRLESELPVHNPLADARQSARLFLEAYQEACGGVEQQSELVPAGCG